MVSMMDVEPTSKGQICDSRQTLVQSAVSQRSIDLHMPPISIDTDLTKKTLKLDLKASYPAGGDGGGGESDKGHSKGSSEMATKGNKNIKSPKSPLTNLGRTSGRVMPHQTSLTSQIDLVEDRKALRDALYQGIFHRHRRTIFAVGSFLRMLRSRNSQYNTIRSSSEGEDDGR